MQDDLLSTVYEVYCLLHEFLLCFQALYFGGEGNLPVLLSRHTIFGIVVDPCAAVVIIVATVLMCTGIKEVCLKKL